jgi:hypothetical protein
MPPRCRVLICLALLLNATVFGLAQEEPDPRRAERRQGTPGAESKPLGMLDGERLFLHWPYRLASDASVVAYDVARREVLWTYPTGEAIVDWMYLTPTCVVVWQKESDKENRLTWLDRIHGQVVHEAVNVPEWSRHSIRDGLLQTRASPPYELYDLSTGKQFFDLSKLDSTNWYWDRKHILCFVRHSGPPAKWILRQFDPATGEPLREIDVIPELTDDVDEPLPGISISHVIDGQAFVFLHGEPKHRYQFIDLATGDVCWQGDRGRYYSVVETIPNGVILSDFTRLASNTNPKSQTRIAIELPSGRPLWKVELPPQAQYQLVDAAGQPLRPATSASNSLVLPFVIDVSTGRVTTPPRGPTLLDQFAWHADPFTLSAEIRRYGDVTVGACVITEPGGLASTFYGWQPDRVETLWQREPSFTPPTWLADVHPSPQFVALAVEQGVQILDTRTGEDIVRLTAKDVGLQERTIASLIAESKTNEPPPPETPAVPPEEQPPDLGQWVFIAACLLAMGSLWFYSRRPTRGDIDR